MKRILLILTLSAPLLTWGAAPPQPNVLFIMTDDLNCNLGAYDHPLVQTPHIDQLASQGVQFSNAYCNFPLCGPSRASFMTGLYPEQNGVVRLRRLFRDYVPEAVTLSQHFMNNGYSTARVGKIYHYDNPNGIGSNGHDDPASWQTRINPRGRDKDEEDKIFSLTPGHFGGTLSWLAADGTDEEQTDGIVATESIGLLKQYAESKEPFFLAVGFYNPHTPYVAPKKYFDRIDPSKIVIPKVPEGYLDTIPAPARKMVTLKKAHRNLPEETIREAIHAYYATISFMDAQVGRVLEGLDELGLRENTIVLFSSDHGYHMGEHGHFMKRTLFEDADRVPLIISAPGMKNRGVTTEAFAEMIDFYRTLSDLAGLPEPPSYVMGKALGPVLEDPKGSVRTSALTQLEDGYTIRIRNYRITRWNTGEFELYDRSVDPAEMVNLANNPEYKELIQNLEVDLSARVAEATARPTGLRFIPPTKKDNGYKQDEVVKIDP